MARYAIYAGDHMYGGLHGMCTYAVIESDSLSFVEDYAINKAYDIIDAYPDIYESLEEEAKNSCEYEEEYETILSELYDEDIEWMIWKINEEKVQDYSTQTLDFMISENPDDFLDNYCISV